MREHVKEIVCKLIFIFLMKTKVQPCKTLYNLKSTMQLLPPCCASQKISCNKTVEIEPDPSPLQPVIGINNV